MSAAPPSSAHANRLAGEASPYLRQHANNPVDWYPWSQEALERSRAENKPILLSVGYSACHWCHVMAHESFESPEIAKLMNEHFINIKIDREERPDLDQLYQGVVQLMGRGGGWPLTVFLTPDLRPFFGGTYFPPQDRHGLPGFPKLLAGLHEAWQKQPADVEAQAEQFKAGLAHLSTYGLGSAPAELSSKDIAACAARLSREIDPVHGGFGGAPKFPNPMNVALLLRGYRRTKDRQLLSAVDLTLEKMASGGIYDQLGGGFHRYSVDERWLVPHFEKMLYDNAQLLHLYAEAQQALPRALWRKVAVETVEYVRREMTSPEGAFYATQDADSEGEEGKFFVWKPDEIDRALSPELSRLVKAHFGVSPDGNFEHGATVLEVVNGALALGVSSGQSAEKIAAELEQARSVLFQAREKRVKPGRDEKILAGWNGLMIRGLAMAARVFDRPDWANHAARAADFVLRAMWKGGRLWRAFQDGETRIDAFIEDYGDLASGLTALYQATFEPRYLEAAAAVSDRAVELFWDAGKSAYLSAPRGQKDLLCPPYALFDNAFPSGASTLAEAQVALAAITGQAKYLDQAGQYLKKMRDEAVRNPFGFGHLLLAADAYIDGAAELTFAGTRSEIAALAREVNAIYAPTVALCARETGAALPKLLDEATSGREVVEGKPAAYLCRGFTCQPPQTDIDLLKKALEAF